MTADWDSFPSSPMAAFNWTKEAEMFALQITLDVSPANRAAAAAVYQRFKAPFLSQVPGAKSKDLLVRNEDVQVEHTFDTEENANGYLESDLFKADVVTALQPLLNAAPEVRIYQVA